VKAASVSPDGQQVWVSEQANGKNVERALGRFHGRKVARTNRVDEVVLDHCRGPNSHVRGCWLVDGLLQKM
jgi:hypothetical protein